MTMPAKQHKTLYGHKVLGNRFNMEALVRLYKAHEVLLALPSAPARDIAAIVQACQNAGVPYRFFPRSLKGKGHNEQNCCSRPLTCRLPPPRCQPY
jgi:FlaA1/EpsC-like NDP-sugar epimerase